MTTFSRESVPSSFESGTRMPETSIKLSPPSKACGRRSRHHAALPGPREVESSAGPVDVHGLAAGKHIRRPRARKRRGVKRFHVNASGRDLGALLVCNTSDEKLHGLCVGNHVLGRAIELAQLGGNLVVEQARCAPMHR